MKTASYLSKELQVLFWCILVINSRKVQRSDKDGNPRRAKLMMELTHLILVNSYVFFTGSIELGPEIYKICLLVATCFN